MLLAVSGGPSSSSMLSQVQEVFSFSTFFVCSNYEGFVSVSKSIKCETPVSSFLIPGLFIICDCLKKFPHDDDEDEYISICVLNFVPRSRLSFNMTILIHLK